MSINLNNVKTQIKSILDTANTTTASRDLSSGMTRRVQRVFKTNVERIPIQGSLIPAVTIFMDSKDIEQATIARTQAGAVRKGLLSVKVAGMIFNPLFQSVDADPADEDLENLMENIEEILRGNSSINSLATWSIPTEVTYHSGIVEEETHFRVGIMNLDLTVFY